KAKDRLEFAKFEAKEVKSLLFPTLYFNTDSTRFVQSKTGIFGSLPPESQAFFPLKYTQTEFNFDFEYEFDFFEKNKNLWRASLGDIQAVKVEEIISRLVLSLSVTETYFRLQKDLIRKQIAEDLEVNREQLKFLTEKSLSQGLGTEILKNKSENDLLLATENRLQKDLETKLDLHLLQSLVASHSPLCMKNFQITFQDLENRFNPVLAQFLAELPLDLIAARADIQVILHHIRSFGFRIKAAEALFYPNINLSLLTGMQTIHLSKLFNGDSFYGTWGPALHLPIFDGGFLAANLGLRKMDYKLAVDAYEEKILEAIRQVLDAKIHLETLQKKLFAAQRIEKNSFSIFKLTEKRRERNLASNYDFFEAKAKFLDAQDQVAELQFLNLQALLNLIQAFGGGY
ncbi:MAG TPA: TolC family protein, partial [Parachlamydiaceae bacterium]|nr:TolC family protein [Parachlamydiaceae bacterium]